MAFTVRIATPLDEDIYKAQRYALIKSLEENGNVSLTGYIDTEAARIPTIGIGFNIGSNLVVILKGMGVSVPTSEFELPYFNRLLAIANSRSYHRTAADQLRLQTDLNKVMADRAADVNIVDAKLKTTFEFSTESQVQSVFSSIASTYDQKIVTWEKQYGISPADATIPSLPFSPELLVLFSLAYNNGGKEGASLLGPGLANAIKTDDRAEAWYEIRYNSNAEQLLGLAKRRIIESEVFGLYDSQSGPTLEEAQETYRMLTLHRRDIFDQEAKWGETPLDGLKGTRLSDGHTALELAQLQASSVSASLDNHAVDTLYDNLKPARDKFIKWINDTQLPPGEARIPVDMFNPAAIFFDPGRGRSTDAVDPNNSVALNAYRVDDLGEEHNDNNLMFGDGGDDFLWGAGGDDILIGGDGADKLYGEAGTDRLYGGDGSDYIEGGKGDDFLYGGDGIDTYVWNAGDGADTIVDAEGGRLIINGDTYVFSVGQMVKDKDANIWRDATGNVVLTHNSPWRIELSDGSVIQLGEGFDPTQWGIVLRDARTDHTYQPIVQTITGDVEEPDSGDSLNGSQGADLIQGLGGSDALYGNGGDDIIEGGVGADRLLGDAGFDRLYGGVGNDNLDGGADNDELFGEAGQDILRRRGRGYSRRRAGWRYQRWRRRE